MKILSTIRTHIPAHPSWWLLEPLTDGARLGQRKVIGIARNPIIGWLLCTDVCENEHQCEIEGSSYSKPITAGASGIPYDGPSVIEAPHGVFIGDDGTSFDDRECVLEYLKEEQARLDAHAIRNQSALRASA